MESPSQSEQVQSLDVPALLASLKGKSVYLPYLRGNQGDVLLELATQRVFARYDIRQARRPSGADWICFRGSGAMNDFWCDGPRLLGHLAQQFPDTPIVVLPSSYHFVTTDLSAMLEGRKAITRLYAREWASYRRLVAMALPAGVHLGHGDDMALHLRDDAFVARWRAFRERQSRDYVLVVERDDMEHHASEVPLHAVRPDPLQPGMKAMAKRMARPSWHAIKRARWRRRGRWGCEPVSPAFAEECRAFLAEHYPASAELPWRSGDVSHHLKYTFREFCSLVAGAAVVVTTRLHAGLMGHMLGVPVALRNGRYGKVQGVYDYSLTDASDVHLIGREASSET